MYENESGVWRGDSGAWRVDARSASLAPMFNPETGRAVQSHLARVEAELEDVGERGEERGGRARRREHRNVPELDHLRVVPACVSSRLRVEVRV